MEILTACLADESIEISPCDIPTACLYDIDILPGDDIIADELQLFKASKSSKPAKAFDSSPSSSFTLHSSSISI